MVAALTCLPMLLALLVTLTLSKFHSVFINILQNSHLMKLNMENELSTKTNELSLIKKLIDKEFTLALQVLYNKPANREKRCLQFWSCYVGDNHRPTSHK